MEPDVSTNRPRVATLLEQARPVPGLAFVADLERALFPARPRRQHRRLAVGTATASALGIVLTVIAFAGGGPGSPKGGDSATAASHCTIIYTTTIESVESVVRRADDSVTVEPLKKPVTRSERRCS